MINILIMPPFFGKLLLRHEGSTFCNSFNHLKSSFFYPRFRRKGCVIVKQSLRWIEIKTFVIFFSFCSFNGIEKDLNQVLLCFRFFPVFDGLKSSFAVWIGKKLGLFQSIRVENEMESSIDIASLRKSPFYEWLQFFMLIGRKKDGSRSQTQPDGSNGHF